MALFMAAQEINNPEFTAKNIIITTDDNTTSSLFQKNLDYLNNLAGGNIIKVVSGNVDNNIKNQDAEKLAAIFGDKFTLK